MENTTATVTTGPREAARVPLSERLALTPAEVAQVLGLGRSATYAGLKNGSIPGAKKIGGVIRVSTAVLKAWIDGEPEAVRLVRRAG